MAAEQSQLRKELLSITIHIYIHRHKYRVIVTEYQRRLLIKGKGDICVEKRRQFLQELVGVMRSIGQNPTEDEILELVLGKSSFVARK